MGEDTTLRIMQARADQVLDTLEAIIKTHNSITMQFLGMRIKELEERVTNMETAYLAHERRLDKAADYARRLQQEAHNHGEVHQAAPQG